jgi:large subunit ribosomal protein L6
MSRLGKLPIAVPKGVDCKIEQTLVSVKGPKGVLKVDTHGRVGLTIADGHLTLTRPDDEKQSKAFHGLYQRLISNMVIGVTEGFAKDLEVQGVGYRVQMEGKTLVCQLGYSHPVRFDPPAGITIECPDQTHIKISGYDKQAVGQTAAEIRAFRPPEPYKGKGVRYVGEYVRRKVGKSGA